MGILDIFGRCNCKDGTSYSVKNKCICTKTYFTGCDEGPTPCGDTVNIDLIESESVNFDACSGGVVFEITSVDDGITNVTINDNGIVSADVDGEPGDLLEIYYKMKCPSLGTAVNGRIVICVQDLCKQTNCLDTEYCDKCTGDCEQSSVDLQSN